MSIYIVSPLSFELLNALVIREESQANIQKISQFSLKIFNNETLKTNFSLNLKPNASDLQLKYNISADFWQVSITWELIWYFYIIAPSALAHDFRLFTALCRKNFVI
jgi:hypothetical protein